MFLTKDKYFQNLKATNFGGKNYGPLLEFKFSKFMAFLIFSGWRKNLPDRLEKKYFNRCSTTARRI